MSKKLRSIEVNIYINHQEFNQLGDLDLSTLQESLRFAVSAKENGKNCISVVRIIPTIATTNTVNIHLVAFKEDIDFTGDEDLVETIKYLIDDYVNVDFDHFFFEQSISPFLVVGLPED